MSKRSNMELGISDKLPYGRYKNAIIGDMLKEPFCETDIIKYLKWWNEVVKDHPFSKEVQIAIHKQIKAMDKRVSEMQREKEWEDMLYKKKYPEKRRSSSNYNRDMDNAIWDYEVNGIDVWSTWD